MQQVQQLHPKLAVLHLSAKEMLLFKNKTTTFTKKEQKDHPNFFIT
jgi:hypothetical protein